MSSGPYGNRLFSSAAGSLSNAVRRDVRTAGVALGASGSSSPEYPATIGDAVITEPRRWNVPGDSDSMMLRTVPHD